MNLNKIIQEATTPQVVLEENKAASEKLQADSNFASALDVQNYQSWLQHPTTQALIVWLHSQINSSMDRALTLSNSTESSEDRVFIQCSLHTISTFNLVTNYITRNK